MIKTWTNWRQNVNQLVFGQSWSGKNPTTPGGHSYGVSVQSCYVKYVLKRYHNNMSRRVIAKYWTTFGSTQDEVSGLKTNPGVVQFYMNIYNRKLSSVEYLNISMKFLCLRANMQFLDCRRNTNWMNLL